MTTGLSIGKLTAMGSIVLIRTIVFRWPGMTIVTASEFQPDQ
jgi:hypothetical protein